MHTRYAYSAWKPNQNGKLDNAFMMQIESFSCFKYEYRIVILIFDIFKGDCNRSLVYIGEWTHETIAFIAHEININ